MADEHAHDEVLHDHEHVHVSHYVRPEEEPTHLTATHGHEHNHPAVQHSHVPHEDPEKEHRREGHIHDHTRPERSPA